MDLTKPLPRKIISGYSNGKETLIEVTYPWLPLKCELCKKYGHLQDKCNSVTPKVGSERQRSVSPDFERNNRKSKRHYHSRKNSEPQVSAERNLEVEEGEVIEDLQKEDSGGESENLLPPLVTETGLVEPSGNTNSTVVKTNVTVGSGFVSGEHIKLDNKAECSGKQL